MCGITGYIGGRPAVETALTNLKRLEYRGYDSAGIAYLNDGRINIVRAVGKIASLERALKGEPNEAQVAIAHTRWATHGRPSKANAHPHADCTGQLAVVHNGIIENYAELRRELIAKGHTFASETDTEVLAHLIEEELSLSLHSDFAASMRTALKRVVGSYAAAIIWKEAPETIYAARKDSPLVIGLGDGENFLASDITAVMRYTRRVVLLEDGDFAIITKNSVAISDLSGEPVSREPMDVTWDDTAAEKGGYPHFMLKEIYEGPRTVRDTMRGRLGSDGIVHFPELKLTPADWAKFRRIAIVGCGTAYHAGVVGKRLFEQLLRRPVEASFASEFRYSDPLIDSETLVVLISQSGETADTLAAMREAQGKGATTMAIVNVMGSTLARDADVVLLTQAGPEIGVASTKAYVAQLTALALLGVFLGQFEGDSPLAKELAQNLLYLPQQIEACLQKDAELERLAISLAQHFTFFYLGRGYDFDAALEAALKLKEISYLHAEAYPAGEMKHGPLALVEPNVAVIGFCTQSVTNDKMLSNLSEVKAREGTVVTVIREGDTIPDCADSVIEVPNTSDPLMPILVMVPMQLLAYHIAKARGCEIDQPRNLAKSVTVE